MTMLKHAGTEGRSWTWPRDGGFHLADRLFFTRRHDGSVTIRWYLSDADGAEPMKLIDCTPEQWASVVASMEATGETAEAWQAALVRQKGGA